MREIGCMFMVLTFLAGITIASIPVGLINVVVFFGLSLGLIRLFGDRLGKQGLAYGMMGAFFVSFAWPIAFLPPLFDGDCEGDMCTVVIPAQTPAAQEANP